jgi:hypothetical protein
METSNPKQNAAMPPQARWGWPGPSATKLRLVTIPLAQLSLSEQRINLIQQDAENCQQKIRAASLLELRF